MLKNDNTCAVPRVTKRLVKKIISRATGCIDVISNKNESCLAWTGEMNRGTPSISIDGQRYRVQLLLYCWYARRKAYPRRFRFKRVPHCYDRRCVNPHHIVSNSLPPDPLFAEPIPKIFHKKKIVTSPLPSDEMSSSVTMSEDCTSVSEDTCDSICDG